MEMFATLDKKDPNKEKYRRVKLVAVHLKSLF